MRPVHLSAAIILLAISAAAQEQATPPAQSTPTPQPSNQAAPRAGRGGREGGFQGGRGGMFMREGSSGAITQISGNVITVKTAAGKSISVKTNAETRFVGKDRTPIALADLKAGDYITAGGQNSGDIIEARMVALMDEQTVKRMQEMQANMGKTIIAGEVKEINDTKLTVQRPDGQSQVIALDENSSIKKQNESVTLADVKPGDRITGTGELKDGVFTVKELRLMMAPERRAEAPKPEKP